MNPIWILLEVTATLVCALAATRLARRSRAAVRHVMVAGAFTVLLVLPFASMVAPDIRVELPPAVQSAIAPFEIESVVDVAQGDNAAANAAVVPAPVTSRRWPSLSVFVIGAWLSGLVIFLLPVGVGLSQVRSLRRMGLPWLRGDDVARDIARAAGIDRTIDVRLHESIAGPMTCGVMRPTILLPLDAPQWPPAELRRALVHELEHVRRVDWLTQCVARAVAAAYWFHPIVWMAWRQLVVEAERACDDAVLRRSSPKSVEDGEAESYAEQLVVLAQRLSAHATQPQLAMASRRDLSTRIVAVLDRHQPRGRAGVLSVATAAAACVVLVLAMSPLRVVAGAQTPALTSSAKSGSQERYEAATIKPCQVEEVPTGARGAAGGTNATFSPGRFFVPCVTTEQLIYLAYASYGAADVDHLINDDPGSASDSTKIRGGPAWVHSLKDKYSIEATAPGATERTVLMGSMLRSLLEERFHLKVHRETEEVPMYELKVAKSGFKLKPMKEGDCVPDDGTRLDPTSTTPRCGTLFMASSDGLTKWSFGTGTMSSLANQLSRSLRIHVIDRTGITDKFVFKFEFTREPDALDIESSAVSTALKDQLGLTITSTKGPRGFIVIDSIERPASPDPPPPDARFARGSGGASAVSPAQTAAPAAPKFEVASIKPCDSSGLPPGARGGGGGNITPGHLLLNCQSVRGYIQAAYLMHPNGTLARPDTVLSTPIEGGPDWIASERYTIEATAAPGTSTLMMQGPMLQALLEDRFALKVRWETREIPTYTLTATRNAKLTPFREGSCVPPVRMSPPGPQPALAPGEVRCNRFTRLVDGNFVVDAQGLTMDEFASLYLFLAAGRTVVDNTGIQGKFDFKLTYAVPDADRKRLAEVGNDPGDSTAPDILVALKDQLGLQLEPSKGPGRFLVIEHVERPKPN